MSNVGREIKDFYCNGYFGRRYDLTGARIIAEGDEFLVIKKEDGVVEFCHFQSINWNKDKGENDSEVKCLEPHEKQKLIDDWCGWNTND